MTESRGTAPGHGADPSLDPARPLALLESCPAYRPSPMTRHRFGGVETWIKDETDRMGLGSFKALGGVYAVARILHGRLGTLDLEPEALRQQAGEVTFICASAGNHGLSVAAGARIFGARARVHLAQTVPEDFAERLRAKGAEIVRSGADYEQSVALAMADAEASGGYHLADGSWPGYTEPPRLVMEGYTVIAEEMRVQFEPAGAWPDRVYLQAGVGGLAAAIAAMIRHNWQHQPEIVVVEPEAAPCLKVSIESGAIQTLKGPVSNMARLDCKTPSLLAFEILKRCADRFVTVSDEEADGAVRRAAEKGFRSTPSGTAGLCAALNETRPPALSLVILSEGATGK